MTKTMTRATRAGRAAARCADTARNLHTAAVAHGGGTRSAELHEQALRYERNAAEWRRLAAVEAAREPRCWCGRRAPAVGLECSEHD